jgi:nicotinamidase-related amidase
VPEAHGIGDPALRGANVFAQLYPEPNTAGTIAANGQNLNNYLINPTLTRNDNQGDFSATRDDLVAGALNGERPDLVKPILPTEDCAFLTKVRHSAFFGTSLEYLLHRSDVERVILTGQVTEQCILYTALDAYIRHLSITVVSDAVAAIDHDLGQAALRMMERNMRAEIVQAESCFS